MRCCIMLFYYDHLDSIIDLFHNGGLLMYSFTYMIISLSDLVWKKVFLCIFHMLTRVERLIIIHVKEYINRPPLWKRSICVMSSLFGIVNSIRLFCILLCIYIFYCLLYFAILTWRFRLLWWRFALSIWQCKVLYPIVQFYILLCTYLCYHPRLGYFRNFCILFCAPVLWSVSSWAILWSCIMLTSYPAWHSVDKN